MNKELQFPFTTDSLNRSGFKLQFAGLFAMVFLSLLFSACSTIRLQINQATKKESVLPRDLISPYEDSNLLKDSACIITVNDDSGTFFIGKDQVSKDQITGKVVEKMKDQTPDKRIIYIESAANVQYETVVSLLNLIRKADIDKIGLVVDKINKQETRPIPTMFEVKLPAEPNERETMQRPNPLTLVVEIVKTEFLLLNKESVGKVNEANDLTNKLSAVFRERENNGVFREGTNEVETTVFLKAPRSSKYGDVVKVIDAVKIAGAQPIGLQIDDLNN